MERNETGKVNKWLKVSLVTPPALVEAVSDFMAVLSGAGVEISADSESRRITGFFPLQDDTRAEREAVVGRTSEALAELFSLYDRELPPIQVEIMDNEDWSTSWKRFYTPFSIIPGLVIRPSWEEYYPSKGEKVIELDPGQAFGTGQHSSTRMALALTRECCQIFPPGRALDVGTGTGILAMAAALFGASEVTAIDNDPQAVQVARENVVLNRLQGRISIDGTPLEDIQGSFDLILANIVHNVLVAMAPTLRSLLSPSGHLVLSGILAGRQEENIIHVYEALGLTHIQTLHDDEWAACAFCLEA
ncbi:50S ribosomal protein L11 methyltransferase [Desulfolithobacter sp.]